MITEKFLSLQRQKEVLIAWTSTSEGLKDLPQSPVAEGKCHQVPVPCFQGCESVWSKPVSTLLRFLSHPIWVTFIFHTVA